MSDAETKAAPGAAAKKAKRAAKKANAQKAAGKKGALKKAGAKKAGAKKVAAKKAEPGRLNQINTRIKELRAELESLRKQKQEIVARKKAKKAAS